LSAEAPLPAAVVVVGAADKRVATLEEVIDDPAALVVVTGAVVVATTAVVTGITDDGPAVDEDTAMVLTGTDTGADESTAALEPVAPAPPTQLVLPARMVKAAEGFVRPNESRMRRVSWVPTACWGVQVRAVALVVPMVSRGAALAWPPGTTVMMNGGEVPEKVI
jgi:hypothetical protein